MTNHKPATLLPWHSTAYVRVVSDHSPSGYRLQIVGDASSPLIVDTLTIDGANANVCELRNKTDAAYIAHAANAYPRLVEALTNLLAWADCSEDGRNDPEVKQSAALLRDLGEAS